MVPVDSRRRAAAQGPAVLSPVRRERGERLYRLRVGAEPPARYLRRADPPSAGERGLRLRRRGLSPALNAAELITRSRRRLSSSTAPASDHRKNEEDSARACATSR